MNTGRYVDRMDAERYKHDEPVSAGLLARKPKYDGWVSIPERLFVRMKYLADAYELHVLPGLETHGDNVLNRERAETLIEELEYLGTVVNDPLLLPHIAALRDAALECTRSPFPGSQLGVEGP